MGDFAAQVNRWANKARNTAKAVVEDAWDEVTKEIIVKWPVGDPASWASNPPAGYIAGLSVNNWHSSVDAPKFAAPTREGLRPEKSTGADSLVEAERVGKDIYGKVGIFINPVTYAFRLEYDAHSMQAPNGVVRLAVQNFKLAVTEAVKKNKGAGSLSGVSLNVG